MDKKLLDILVCPATGSALTLLEPQKLEQINAQISSKQLRYGDGSAVEQTLEAGLITSDGNTAYRVDNGIPVMLPERGIACEKNGSSK